MIQHTFFSRKIIEIKNYKGRGKKFFQKKSGKLILTHSIIDKLQNNIFYVECTFIYVKTLYFDIILHVQ